MRSIFGSTERVASKHDHRRSSRRSLAALGIGIPAPVTAMRTVGSGVLIMLSEAKHLRLDRARRLQTRSSQIEPKIPRYARDWDSRVGDGDADGRIRDSHNAERSEASSARPSASRPNAIIADRAEALRSG